MVALVSKQVTAYNAVNNSTVSRTSASKYGKSRCADKVQESTEGEIPNTKVVTRQAPETKADGKLIGLLDGWQEERS